MNKIELSYKLEQTKRNLGVAESILDVFESKGVHEIKVETVKSLLVSVRKGLAE